MLWSSVFVLWPLMALFISTGHGARTSTVSTGGVAKTRLVAATDTSDRDLGRSITKLSTAMFGGDAQPARREQDETGTQPQNGRQQGRVTQKQGAGPSLSASSPRFSLRHNLNRMFNHQHGILAGAYLADVTSKYEEIMKELLSLSYLPRATWDRMRMNDSLPSGFQVERVFRITSTNVSNRYEEYKKKIGDTVSSFDRARCKETNGNKSRTRKARALRAMLDQDTCLNEQWLFHGTGATGVYAIGEKGFDTARAGSKTGTLLGPGIYLTDSSTKADEYTAEERLEQTEEKLASTKHVRRLLLCKAVLGRPLVLYPTPEYKKTLKFISKANYSAVTDMLNTRKRHCILRDGEHKFPRKTFKEYAVFDAAAILPQFIIEYTREYAEGQLDNRCPAGYKFTSKDLDAQDKKFEPSGKGDINECVGACNNRVNCGSIEFNYKRGDCWSYLGVPYQKNIQKGDWVSCIQTTGSQTVRVESQLLSNPGAVDMPVKSSARRLSDKMPGLGLLKRSAKRLPGAALR